MVDKTRALKYHEFPIPGKLSIAATKPCETAHDLSLAYSPGVAEPCLAIAEDRELAYNYTSKGNLVAVISDGTAVLGLGDIGPDASKPVMEGKAILFKSFADIDVFDLELDCAKDPDRFIETVVALAPTFGGINLEDIKAPQCFKIESELKKRLDIPVFHDDQHGTAIIASAALLNALELSRKDIAEVRLVVSGAGAAAVACAKLLYLLGLNPENLLMVDSKGVIYAGRSEGMNEFKEEFARKTQARTLADALSGADVFLGLSMKGLVSPEMLLSMAENPIVFAMANPDPEIDYHLAKKTRADAIVATGRSDYPNQVNNVLGFPFIFRGALDVRAKQINDEMKLAAVHALARLAKEPVPDSVRAAYGNSEFGFSADYLIPKPFDPRVLYYVSPAVAEAAIRTGVARRELDLGEYTVRLKGKQNKGRSILRGYYSLAKKSKRKRIAFPEGDNPRVLTAAIMAQEEGIAEPVFIGDAEAIAKQAALMDISLDGIEVLQPASDKRFRDYVENYYALRNRSGLTFSEAERRMSRSYIFANMLLAQGEVDGAISGVGQIFPKMVRPILEIVGLKEGYSTAAGLYLLSIKDRLLFFADTAINIEMDEKRLADIAMMTAEFARSMNVEPRVAMLSFSSFGSVNHRAAKMVKHATELVKSQVPDLQIDGEMQADAASDWQILSEYYPFTTLHDRANVFIFPDMQSGNISYKLLQRFGGARVVGPIILGLNSPSYVLQRHASVDEVFNMITVAVARAAEEGEAALPLFKRAAIG